MTSKTSALKEPFIGSFEDLSKGVRLKAIKQIPVRPMEPLTEGIIIRRMEKVEGSIDPDYQEYLSTVLDQTKDYPDPVPVLSIRQKEELIPIFTEKSISLFQGKQKSKKTTFLALAIAAYIAPKESGTDSLFACGSEGVVLFIDTEQGESYAARTMKLILKLEGIKSSDRLKYSDMREKNPAKRINLIRAAVKNTPNVKLVVIDGIVDLMDDFMAPEEAHSLVTDLLKMASMYNIHIAGVLHQNKGDSNARAHIGTIMSQKCEIEISTTANKEDKSISEVECVNSRGLPFNSFNISWKKGELPKIENIEGEARIKPSTCKQTNSSKLQELADKIFNPGVEYRHTDLIKQIVNIADCSRSTAITRLKEMVDRNLIIAMGANQDKRYVRITVNENGLTCLNPK